VSDSIYDELLRIKSFHEQSAANEVTRRTRAVEACACAVKEAQEESARYHRYRLRHEQELFDGISGREVSLQDVQDMRTKVAGMRAEVVRKQDRIGEEQKRLEEAWHALEETRRRHLEAIREEEKIKQLLEVQREVERREEVLAEDNEIEEIVTARWGRRP
jgi:hypothetical protein